MNAVVFMCLLCERADLAALSCSPLYFNKFHMPQTCEEWAKKRSDLYKQNFYSALHVQPRRSRVSHLCQNLESKIFWFFMHTCTSHTLEIWMLSELRLKYAEDSTQNKQRWGRFTIHGLSCFGSLESGLNFKNMVQELCFQQFLVACRNNHCSVFSICAVELNSWRLMFLSRFFFLQSSKHCIGLHGKGSRHMVK